LKKLFSIVVTVYKDEFNLPVTVPHYIEVAKKFEDDFDVEFIFVNDASPDNSYSQLKLFQKMYPQKIKLLNLTRNFGQSSAMIAGFKYAKGDVVGYITSDMQDPIELFEDMLREWSNGNKLVIAERMNREDSGLSIIFSKLVHYFIHHTIDKKFPKGGYDFFLMDRIVVNKLLEINERNGQTTILLLWLGYKYTTVEYTRKRREIGKSGWSFSAKLEQVVNIFTTNSYLPLRIISSTGIVSAFFGFTYGIYSIVMWTIFGSEDARGWTSIIVLITFFSGLILLSLGIIGEYLWRIFDYLKQRPQYIIDEIIDDTEK